jgi:hypothetical protein
MRPIVLATLALLGGSACGLASAQAPPPKLVFPVACEVGRTCEIQRYVDRQPGPGLLDYRCGRRTGENHNGVDIRLPDMRAQQRGVDVLAAAAGTVFRVRDGVADVAVTGATAAAVDAIGLGNAVVIDHPGGWRTAYGHMAKGSVRVKPGDKVAAGQPIGKVGLSGLTEFPHLHFIVQRGDTPVDPFAPAPVAPGSCAAQTGLWAPEVAAKMPYKAGTLLNAGFAGEAVTMPGIENGLVAPATASSAVFVTYARFLQLDKGDELEMVLTGPGGAVLATQRVAPFPTDKAQYFHMIGKKRPPTGWRSGVYTADIRLHRAGKVVIQKRIETRL